MQKKCRRMHIGTDCSGTDAPSYGLRATKLHKEGHIKIVHEWACNTCPAAKQFIALNHKPKVFFDNIKWRRHEKLKPVHIYTCGFPCQNWSCAGKMLGWEDPRMAVYRAMMKTLKTASIQSFILENVPRLLTHNQGKTIAKIVKRLKECGFFVKYRVYNTLDFGLPQHRRRLYIVGLRGGEPSLPDALVVKTAPISKFLEKHKARLGTMPTGKRARQNLKKVIKHMKATGASMKQSWVVDVDASERFLQGKLNCSPTVTRARALGFWVTIHNRRMSAVEQFRLQGFPVDEIVALQSRTNMGRLAGNCMSVPALTHMLDSLLPKLGF